MSQKPTEMVYDLKLRASTVQAIFYALNNAPMARSASDGPLLELDAQVREQNDALVAKLKAQEQADQTVEAPPAAARPKPTRVRR